MADTKLTALSALTSLTADDLLYAVDDPGGTPASKKITALDAFGLLYGAGMVSVTGTVTATIGRMHYCTGTSADYTITLPAASGNAGKLLGFQMAPIASLSKIVTLDGNASELIDGATTRIMWALESAVLLCDGSNWFKVAGKTNPMAVKVTRSTSQSMPTGNSPIVYDTVTQINAPAVMFNSGTGFVNIQRLSIYSFSGFAVYTGMTGASPLYPVTYVNAVAQAPYLQYVSSAAGSAPTILGFTQTFAVGDVVTLGLNPSTAATLYSGDPGSLTITELPTW